MFLNWLKWSVWQRKVYEEQKVIFANDMERDSTYHDLQEMNYLDVFIKESQRIAPAVPFIGREAEENIKMGIEFDSNDKKDKNPKIHLF